MMLKYCESLIEMISKGSTKRAWRSAPDPFFAGGTGEEAAICFLRSVFCGTNERGGSDPFVREERERRQRSVPAFRFHEKGCRGRIGKISSFLFLMN